MIFPDVDTSTYTERDRSVVVRMEAFYAASLTVNMSFWTEADIDTRFMANDQTLWSDLYGQNPGMNRQQFNFNRIARIINKLDGHQRNNRKSTVVVGVENADNDTADQFTKVISNIYRREGVLETISNSFRQSLITGLDLLHIWIDYRNDPISGDIKVDSRAYNSVIIDPFFRKSDLSDCNGVLTRSFLTRREACSLLPMYEQEIMAMSGNFSRDGKFMLMPESYSFTPKDLLAYDEFYYRDYRKQKLLVDTETGDTQEWRGENDESLKEFLLQYPQIEIIETTIPTVNMAILLQGRVMYDGPQSTGLDHYPFIPVLAYYYPNMPYYQYRLQGVVRVMRDSQYLYNRRMVTQLRILESQINSGYIVAEDVLVNPKDAVSLQGEGRVLFTKAGFSPDLVKIIPPPSLPSGMMEATKIMGEEMNQVVGISDEQLGFDNKDTLSGYHAQLKMSAGMTTTQILYDNLDHAQKILGERTIELIQMNYTPGKIKRMLEGEEPSEQFYSKAFGKYGAAVEEGLNTSTQKQQQMIQLLQMRQMEIPIPDDVIIEASTMQNKKRLIEAMQQEKEALQQQQQAQQESANALNQSQIKLNEARAVSDQGLGLERVSRVEENEALAVERRAQAIRDEDAGLLEKVRALKEIEGMDLSHLKELHAMLMALRTQPEETGSGKSEADAKQEELKGALEAQPAMQPQPIGQPNPAPAELPAEQPGANNVPMP